MKPDAKCLVANVGLGVVHQRDGAPELRRDLDMRPYPRLAPDEIVALADGYST